MPQQAKGTPHQRRWLWGSGNEVPNRTSDVRKELPLHGAWDLKPSSGNEGVETKTGQEEAGVLKLMPLIRTGLSNGLQRVRAWGTCKNNEAVLGIECPQAIIQDKLEGVNGRKGE